MSAAGRYTVFAGAAINLVPGQLDSNSGNDVFRYDRVADQVMLVSHSTTGPLVAGNAESSSVSLSADGVFVGFLSLASNLVLNDFAGTDVFLASPLVGNAPMATPAVGLSRQQGSAGTSSARAAVSDVETTPGALTVTVIRTK